MPFSVVGIILPNEALDLLKGNGFLPPLVLKCRLSAEFTKVGEKVSDPVWSN